MLASADAYLHGCPAETFGLVIAEALCAGLPQIVPDRGGAAEIPSADSAEFFEADNVHSCARWRLRDYLPEMNKHSGKRFAEMRDSIGDMAGHFRALFRSYENIADQYSDRRRRQQVAVPNDSTVCHQAA